MVSTINYGAGSRIWKLPITLSDGSKSRAILDVTLRPRVVLDDGTVEVGTNSPDAYPPTGAALITLSNGSTVTVAYEEDQWSMDLTTIARVKARSGAFGSATTHDSLLSSIITAVSARAEKLMSRTVLRQTQTAVHPITQYSSVVFLESLPVESVMSVKYCSHPSDFTGATALSATSYVMESTRNGTLRLQIDADYYDPRRPGYVQVVYVGGMADDVADFVATYPDIAAAVDQQVLYEWQRRNAPSGSTTAEQVSASFNNDLQWLPNVLDILNSHKRIVI